MKISELKKEAIAKLSGKWGKAAGIYLLVTLLSFGLTFIPSLSGDAIAVLILNLLVSIISFAFSYGLLASMIKLSRTEKVDIMDFVTIGLKNIFKIIKIYLLMVLKLWLPILLYLVGGFLTGVAAYIAGTGNPNGFIYLIGAFAFLFFACIYFIVRSLLYSLPFYLLYDNPNAKTNDLLNKSAEIMKGNRFKLVLTEFSFFGWALLIILVFILSAPIAPAISLILLLAGSIVLSPYVHFTMIRFYEHAAGINDVKAEIITETEVVETENVSKEEKLEEASVEEKTEE